MALHGHPVVGLCRRPACESLATKLGEPGGTLILTLAVTGIKVMMISAVILTGKGNQSLARDAMFAVVMIALTGVVS